MDNDERDRDPRPAEPVDDGASDSSDATDVADEERSAEEFETVPPGAPPSADRPPWPVEDAAAREAAARDDSVAEDEAVAHGDEVVTEGDQPPAGPPPREAEAYPPPNPAPDGGTQTAAHTVPATPVGESTQCPRCGTENRPGVAFCRNCGQRLVAAGVATTVQRPGSPEGTQQCPRCGTHNRAGVAFCQNCGANLRAAAAPAAGYVPPTVAPGASSSTGDRLREEPRGGAVLGPVVLLVGLVGLVTAYLLPFPYGVASLWDRAFQPPTGYGIAMWDFYGSIGGGVADKAYFGFAAAVPVLVVLLALLAIAGFLRAAPGGLQRAGLVIALLWALGLAVLFLVVEVAASWSGDVVALLRGMSPGGIIFLLAALIILIGGLTRLARS